MRKCLVISYCDDQQEWFYDTILAESTSVAEKFILRLRPYCNAADGSLARDFMGTVSLKIKGTTWDASERLSECQDCRHIFPESRLKPIADLHQRVEAGETMPSGECPECGALCSLLDGQAR